LGLYCLLKGTLVARRRLQTTKDDGLPHLKNTKDLRRLNSRHEDGGFHS